MVAYEDQNPEGINRGESRCDKALADPVPVSRTVTLISGKALRWIILVHARRLGGYVAERPNPLQLRPLVGRLGAQARQFGLLVFGIHQIAPPSKRGIGCLHHAIGAWPPRARSP